jgi:hypothetical protein
LTRASRASGLNPALLAGAALFAAAEIGLAILAGGFFDWGRAEASLFLVYRRWLLLAAAILVAGLDWRSRLAFYVLALALAGLAESLLLTGLGAEHPWPEMARGLVAGAAVIALADGAIQLGRRLAGRWGGWAGALLVLLLIALPIGQRVYESVVLPGGDRAEAASKPDLLLMTGLPIIWGEGGAFDPGSRPAGSYRLLQREFTIRPLDSIEPATLAGSRLMLLAQSRLLAPEELVALDSWVRGGGKLLILTDPRLLWPSELPLGDVRRPPALPLLGPLLGHWGLSLEEPTDSAPLVDHLRQPGGLRRLGLPAPGRFAVTGRQCRLGARPWLAFCRIGRGEAALVADADLMHDGSWTSGEESAGSNLRRADNPLLVADLLDGLAGLDRPRISSPIAWTEPDSDRLAALLRAALPLIAALALALAMLYRRRKGSTNLSTGMETENGGRTKL